MQTQSIGGLFKDQASGAKALGELQKAGFASARITKAGAEIEAFAEPSKLASRKTELFRDYAASGADFRHHLTQLGLSGEDAHYFEEGIERGGDLVVVKVDGSASEAVAILQRNGADIGTNAVTSTSRSSVAPEFAPVAQEVQHSDQTVELHAERLVIEKSRIGSGTVRIRKDVITEQQDINVPVSHDELVIERHRIANGAIGGTIGGEKTITIPLSRDEVKVGKDTFVTEEIEIGKRAVGETRHVTELVRHEELTVDESDRLANPRP